MTIRFSVKYAAMILALGALAASAVYFSSAPGTSLLSERSAMVALIGTFCALLVGFRGPIASAWQALTRDAAPLETANTAAAPDQFDQDDAASVGQQKASQFDSLKFALGERALRRQPRLLVTGDNAVVRRLLPELTSQGWLSTGDVLLLWSAADTDGRPDDAWLKQIYTLRRRRPIDAVILTLDGRADATLPRRGINANSVTLTRIADVLHWSAPVYALDVAQTDEFGDGRTALIGCDFPANANERAIESTLLALRSEIGHKSIAHLIRNSRDTFGAILSRRLDKRSAPLAALIASLAGRNLRHQAVRGAFFAPYPVATDPVEEADPGALTAADLPLWKHLATISRKARGRRVNGHPLTVFSTVAFGVTGIWIGGMLVSGLTNGRDVIEARMAVQAMKTAPDPAARLQALLALQQQIGFSEQRVAHQPPLWTRFGLNQDKAILAALWPSYTTASRSLLITPIQENLEATLVDLSQMPTDSLDDHANAAAIEGHKALKTYLMLADPNRVDAGFIAPQLTHY